MRRVKITFSYGIMLVVRMHSSCYLFLGIGRVLRVTEVTVALVSDAFIGYYSVSIRCECCCSGLHEHVVILRCVFDCSYLSLIHRKFQLLAALSACHCWLVRVCHPACRSCDCVELIPVTSNRDELLPPRLSPLLGWEHHFSCVDSMVRVSRRIGLYCRGLVFIDLDGSISVYRYRRQFTKPLLYCVWVFGRMRYTTREDIRKIESTSF